MGRYTYPCPRCGQQQATQASGEKVEHRLCAACREATGQEVFPLDELRRQDADRQSESAEEEGTARARSKKAAR